MVSTAWQVNDTTAAEISVQFFKELKDSPNDPALALRKAQLSFINNPDFDETSTPKYWSAFTVQSKGIEILN